MQKDPDQQGGLSRRPKKPTASPITALEKLVGFELRRAHNASARKFVEFMSELSLKPGQYSLLLAIERKPGQTQSTIAQLLTIDRSSIVPLVDQLERKGLVERVRRLDDMRAHALQLTAKGEDVLNRSRSIISAHERAITKSLSAKERSELIRLLRIVRKNCAK